MCECRLFLMRLGSFKGSKLGAQLLYQLLVNYIVRHITDSWKYNYGKFVLSCANSEGWEHEPSC